MRTFFYSLAIFILVFLIYFAIGTDFSFKPKWALDYFNLLSQSLQHFRLDIENPGSTYDLSYYKGKWYGTWGILPAILLIPFQIATGRFIPIFYLSVLFASLNVVFVYLLLIRIKKEFLPNLSQFGIGILLLLFAFGTANFYVGTLGSVWHVDQIVTSFLATLGIYIIFKKNRSLRDYLISSAIFSLAFLGRPTIVLSLTLPLLLYFWEVFDKNRSVEARIKALKKGLFIFGAPFLCFMLVFFLYNYFRFENIFDYGFNYIHEAPYLARLREQTGAFSFANVPKNLWYMLFEIPGISLGEKIMFSFNLNGNSILFLTPPFFAALLASPIVKKSQKYMPDFYIIAFWVTAIVTIFPSLMHYGSGWMQFGYRYSLDITVLLLVLSVFGIKGKINTLFVIGTIVSIVLYTWGIRSLV